MSSLSDSQEDSFSYEGESDMVEDLFLGNRKSSPVVLSRRESVFLAESSFSSSEGHGSQQTSEGSVQEDNKTSLIARENIAESEHLTIDEGQEHYSDWFESTSASERSSDARFQDTISLKVGRLVTINYQELTFQSVSAKPLQTQAYTCRTSFNLPYVINATTDV